MTYELALQLKRTGLGLDARVAGRSFIRSDGTIYPYVRGELPHATDCLVLTLEELIEACGDKFCKLTRNEMSDDTILWTAIDFGFAHVGEGSTPTEAVARLWLALNKHEAEAA